MTDQNFEKLVEIDLIEGWKHESADFTPWLADNEENLQMLGDTLGMTLELEAREKSVGSFSADIVCTDMDTNARVLIENQLYRTDHDHLGKLLTYVAGLEAVTAIWITKKFRDEHRAALEWINKNTHENVRFFGLEIQLWKIGNSLPAPKFNIVVKPNNWSREISRVVHQGEISESGQKHKEYWAAFLQTLGNTEGPINSALTPLPQSWMSFAIGRSRFALRTAANRYLQQIRVDLYITGSDANSFFHLLHKQKDEIENDLGHSLAWEELPGQDSRIVSYNPDTVDPDNKEGWTEQHKWLAEKLNSMHRAFSNRVRALDAADWNPGGDGDSSDPDSDFASPGDDR